MEPTNRAPRRQKPEAARVDAKSDRAGGRSGTKVQINGLQSALPFDNALCSLTDGPVD